MSKEINKQEFWKERIDLAKKQGNIHYSVYLASENLWKLINDSHKKIIENLIDCENDTVLDLGCGYGRMSEQVNNYVGIDFSEDFINEAKERYPNKEFLVADFKDIPFFDKEFDWGIMISIKNMVIGNLGNTEWKKIEMEVRRVCKKILILEYGEFEDYRDNELSISKYEIICEQVQ